jgi:exonuclease III
VRLVTWNCNGALRRNFEQLDALNADILVIQECEDPAQSTAEYQAWAGAHAWVGYGKNKGIGIFPRRGQSIDRLAWPDSGFELFLPVRVGDNVDVLGVWTQQSKSSKFSYIGQFWHYLLAHKADLRPNTIIAGDFNSNAIWDKPRRTWNHSDCVRELEELGFRSVYHHVRGEEHGQEIHPTFYLHRHFAKPYHIDFVFAHLDWLGECTVDAKIGTVDDWLALSDHMPIIFDT